MRTDSEYREIMVIHVEDFSRHSELLKKLLGQYDSDQSVIRTEPWQSSVKACTAAIETVSNNILATTPSNTSVFAAAHRKIAEAARAAQRGCKCLADGVESGEDSFCCGGPGEVSGCKRELR